MASRRTRILPAASAPGSRARPGPRRAVTPRCRPGVSLRETRSRGLDGSDFQPAEPLRGEMLKTARWRVNHQCASLAPPLGLPRNALSPCVPALSSVGSYSSHFHPRSGDSVGVRLLSSSPPSYHLRRFVVERGTMVSHVKKNKASPLRAHKRSVNC